MPISFTSPEWFFLIPTLLLVGWFWKRTRLFSPLRLALALLLVLVLVEPTWRRQQNSLDLWLLLDRSDSTENLVDKGLPEWQRLLERARPSARDRLKMVNFGADVVESEKDDPVFSGSRKLTRTGLALETVLALAEEDRPARVLLFTDGYSTEPLDEIGAKLAARGIPLDFRLIRDQVTDDFRVARLDLPARTQVGEPFLLGITVRGHEDREVPLIIQRSGQAIGETKVKLVNGVGRVEFAERLARSGSYLYSAEIRPERDAHAGNNRMERWVEATGGPRLLLVTNYTDDPVARALADLNFVVETVRPQELRQGQLSGTRAVIFNNVGAFEVPPKFLDSLDFFVRDQGGGFLMVGGDRSFGAGGYFQSSVDDLLPVSMELKNEHRKLAVAMAVVLDRSGSMAVTVDGGRTKMDLADQGTASAIELLGPADNVTVFAVDSSPYKIVPLTKIGNQKADITGKVRRIQSTGGGIYVYEGLKAGWDELKKADTGTRHMILFSDASDSEEPGDYKRLLKEMTDAGCTVSVIGLGTPADPDAALLEDIAKLGNGRIFFTDRAAELPKIFAQETVTVARSAFIKEPVEVKATGRWAEISPKPFAWLPQADGYNLSYARPDATTSLATTDEYLAPLVAHSLRGIGRTAAVSFPLAGEYSDLVRQWPQYGDFVQTLTRWLMGMDLPPGIGLRHRMDGTRLTVDLLYDTKEWGKRLGSEPPRLRLLEDGPNSVAYEVPWRRIAPGKFSVTRDVEEGAVLRGVIQVGSHALPFGPIMVGTSAEWALEPERIAELRTTSQQTGGRELLDLSDAWLRPVQIRETGLRIPLLLLALAFMLTDTLVTRTGWTLPVMRWLPRRAKAPKQNRQIRHAQPIPAMDISNPLQDDLPATPQPEDDAEGQVQRQSRFDRAKRKR
jgi:hypothetical protein